MDDGHGSCIESIAKRYIFNGRKLVAYEHHVTVNTVTGTRNGGPNARALLLSREMKDWKITGRLTPKHLPRPGRDSRSCPEQSRRSDGVVSLRHAVELWNGRITGRPEVSCSNNVPQCLRVLTLC